MRQAGSAERTGTRDGTRAADGGHSDGRSGRAEPATARRRATSTTAPLDRPLRTAPAETNQAYRSAVMSFIVRFNSSLRSSPGRRTRSRSLFSHPDTVFSSLSRSTSNGESTRPSTPPGTIAATRSMSWIGPPRPPEQGREHRTENEPVEVRGGHPFYESFDAGVGPFEEAWSQDDARS